MNEIRIDRGALKRDARAAMLGRKPSTFSVTIVFLVFTLVLELLSIKLQYPGLTIGEILRSSYTWDEDLYERLISAAENRSALARLLDFAVSIMDLMLTGGFTLFCLYVSRRAEAGAGTLFDLFSVFFRFLWLNIVIAVIVSLWSLLLVIPGVIAYYRCSMAIYIFFDDPDKGVLQCIRESKAMTMGSKGQIFLLDLSFIGWALLSAIPFVAIYTLPYIGVTRANCYRFLSGQMAAETQPPQQSYGDPWNQ